MAMGVKKVEKTAVNRAVEEVNGYSHREKPCAGLARQIAASQRGFSGSVRGVWRYRHSNQARDLGGNIAPHGRWQLSCSSERQAQCHFVRPDSGLFNKG